MLDYTIGVYNIDSDYSKKGRLILGDGKSFCGVLFGHIGETYGTVVFSTVSVGYIESLSDPSYLGQIIVLTSPLVGNYGIPSNEKDEFGLERYFESSKIYATGLVVSDYSVNYSHWSAIKSLDDWLKENRITCITGVDTRSLTKHLRIYGTMDGIIAHESNFDPEKSLSFFKTSAIKDLMNFEKVKRNNLLYYSTEKINSEYVTTCHTLKLIEGVYDLDKLLSNKISTFTGTPWKCNYLDHNDPNKYIFPVSNQSKHFLVIVLDLGAKNNIIRSAVRYGLDNVNILVVPYDYDFNKMDYDGLLLSNGPDDPTMWTIAIESVKKAMQRGKPIFGICLGSQLIALASGARVYRMHYGNRGFNHPCMDLRTHRCYSTSQNHGYSVELKSLSTEWAPLFVNANDGSVEGIIHRMNHWFGVQFHPEACGGPNDTMFLFYDFFCLVKTNNFILPHIIPISFPFNCRKVLLLGSGGLIIGQAGEFDYSGSQAVKALKETGVSVILINPNIATVQTSKGMAHNIYFLPVNADYVKKVIIQEKPDGILCGFGGQTALNVATELYKEGTPIQSIIKTEDRELFEKEISSLGLQCAPSRICNKTTAIKAANEIGYPVLVRGSFELGGLGSGIARNDDELMNLCKSDTIYLDKYLEGYKEIEYEILRDEKNNCISVCNMENFDPLGIHTGDSIVVAPSQTLSNHEYYSLRDASFKIARYFKIVGECNVQFALNPNTFQFYVVEVNARLSRSSTLASKATGYPIAYVAAKVAMGYDLLQLRNKVTRVTTACFEPSLDYVIVKIPKWDLEKFEFVSNNLGTCMKSVGEVMALGRTFEESIQKAIRMSFDRSNGFEPSDAVTYSPLPKTIEEIKEALKNPTPYRIFVIAKAFVFNITIEEINQITGIDKWFLYKLKNIHNISKMISSHSIDTFDENKLLFSKKMGFSDLQISKLLTPNTSEIDIANLRYKYNILPKIRQIDTVSAEFPCQTSYFYYTFNAIDNDAPPLPNDKVKTFIVIGCGPYRIGSSIEFDWSAVQCVNSIRSNGHQAIVVNCNPETVSTDSDVSDRLYFEELTIETLTDIFNYEKPDGLIVSFGGQTANNLALQLKNRGVHIIGTSVESIDMCENRNKFSKLCDTLGADQPSWEEVTSFDHVLAFSRRVGYPVLVRPSYVLSGAAMRIINSDSELERFITTATKVSRDYPVVISKFISNAKEVEMDCVAAEGKILNYAISEHVETSETHSGDSTLILPAQNLFVETHRRIKKSAQILSKALNISGPFNIQFLCKANEIKIIECNLRASRTMPFISKTLDIDFVDLATRVMIGLPYRVQNLQLKELNYVAVKVPVFSFKRLSNSDPLLGVEMKSTGEVACFGTNKYEAFLKTFIASGMKIPRKTILLSIGCSDSKFILAPKILTLLEMGFKIYATMGTFQFLSQYVRSYSYSNGSIRQLYYDYDNREYGDYLYNEEYNTLLLSPTSPFKLGDISFHASPTNDSTKNPMDKLVLVHKTSFNELPSTTSVILSGEVELTVNITTRVNSDSTSEGYKIRRCSIDNGVSLVTNLKLASLLFDSIIRERRLNEIKKTMMNATRYDKYYYYN